MIRHLYNCPSKLTPGRTCYSAEEGDNAATSQSRNYEEQIAKYLGAHDDSLGLDLNRAQP